MPPTFLLIAFLIAVGLTAPVVLLVTVAVALLPRTRQSGLRALLAGLAGAALLMAFSVVLTLAVGEPGVLVEWLVIAGAVGFNAGVCWRVLAFLGARAAMPASGTHAHPAEGAG